MNYCQHVPLISLHNNYLQHWFFDALGFYERDGQQQEVCKSVSATLLSREVYKSISATLLSREVYKSVSATLLSRDIYGHIFS